MDSTYEVIEKEFERIIHFTAPELAALSVDDLAAFLALCHCYKAVVDARLQPRALSDEDELPVGASTPPQAPKNRK